MFQFLGKVVARHWLIILALWIVMAAVGWKFAPAWEAVTRTGEIDFLPKTAPSQIADRFFQETFKLEYSAGNVALILARTNGPLEERDFTFLRKDVIPTLNGLADEDKSPIENIRHMNEEGVGALLVSSDKKATIVLIDTSTPFQDPRNVPLVASIERSIRDWSAAKKIPDGLELALTGSAAAGRDLDVAEASGARTIERWTIAIVIAILLILYRAPLVAVIPLLSVAISVEVSMRLLGWLASTGIFAPARDLRVFVTVLAYGAGVDYCLFLIARYREELENGIPPVEALEHSIGQVGGAITASAATVICGIGMLAFASFGKIHEAGLVIPLALTIALISTLTFAGSLLRLTGPIAFWPHKIAKETAPNFWDRIGPLLVRRAGTVFLVANVLLLPFIVLGIIHYHDQNYNPLSDLPTGATSQVGSRVLTRHFPAGILGPIVVLVESESLDFADPKNDPVVAELTDRLNARMYDLELADVRTLTQPLGASPAGKEKLASLKAKVDVSKDVRVEAVLYYVSATKNIGGRVMRLDLTLTEDPLNRSGIDSLKRIQREMPSLLPAALRNARVEFAGTTASIRDLSDIKAADQQLIQVLVSAIVLLLLIIILRRVVISVYLVVSVLLSYLATLGLTDLVFRTLGGDEFIGLDWKVPIFLFTILVAVGEDYNIFLLTRVKEEQDDYGPMDAIPHALARTGKVISSCGFVMAGTFASLLSGSLQAMKQLGFALTIGVLLDTLVVRPILVPTFLVLLQKTFPGRMGRFMALGHWEKNKPDEPTM